MKRSMSELTMEALFNNDATNTGSNKDERIGDFRTHRHDVFAETDGFLADFSFAFKSRVSHSLLALRVNYAEKLRLFFSLLLFLEKFTAYIYICMYVWD